MSTIKISPQLEHRSCSYELFQLIIEKHRFNATAKTLNHSICHRVDPTHEESNKIRFFYFMIFL